MTITDAREKVHSRFAPLWPRTMFWLLHARQHIHANHKVTVPAVKKSVSDEHHLFPERSEIGRRRQLGTRNCNKH